METGIYAAKTVCYKRNSRERVSWKREFKWRRHFAIKTQFADAENASAAGSLNAARTEVGQDERREIVKTWITITKKWR